MWCRFVITISLLLKVVRVVGAGCGASAARVVGIAVFWSTVLLLGIKNVRASLVDDAVVSGVFDIFVVLLQRFYLLRRLETDLGN